MHINRVLIDFIGFVIQVFRFGHIKIHPHFANVWKRGEQISFCHKATVSHIKVIHNAAKWRVDIGKI